jgi:hypothetical protein
MRKIKWITAIIYILTSTSAFAQLRGTDSGSTPGTATYGSSTPPVSTGDESGSSVTPSQNQQTTDNSSFNGYTPIVTDNSGIQSAGKSSSGNNKIGMILGVGATAYAGYNAVACCASECGKCMWWVAGTLAAVTVTGYMMSAKKQSDATVAAVTDPAAGSTSGSGTSTSTGTNGSTGTTSDGNYAQDPAWINAQKSIDQLRSTGWNVDPTTGTATNTKTGQTIKASDLTSASTMAAAGYSPSDIKTFGDIMNQAKDAGKKLAAARGADAAGDLFDGSVGGGKSSSASASGSGGGSVLNAVAARQGMGIDRNPAQVAGMSKSYNGEQIGVAQDSLFNMIDRRYQLHDQNGHFISSP